MKQKLLTVLAIVVFVFTFSTMAGAVVLTFDDVPGGSTQDGIGPLHGYGDEDSYQGFKILNETNHPLRWVDSVRDGTYDWGGSKSGEFTMHNELVGESAIITSNSGQDFTFDWLYARVWGEDSRLVDIEGYKEGTLVWSDTGLTLDTDWRKFIGSVNKLDMLKLNFGHAFLVDDLALNEGEPPPIPEPATMLLLGSGLVGLAGTKLRKKKK